MSNKFVSFRLNFELKKISIIYRQNIKNYLVKLLIAWVGIFLNMLDTHPQAKPFLNHHQKILFLQSCKINAL